MDIFNHLSPGFFIILVFCAGLTSFLTACLGAGGGVMLLGIMAQIIPPQLIIPLHGVVQLGSNGGRTTLSWPHIRWYVLQTFLPGAIIGAIAGYFLLTALPPPVIYLTIAGFILYLCWGPKLPKLALGPVGTLFVGMITTFLAIFVGASGPLVGAFLKQMAHNRYQTVATFSAAMTLQHLSKLIVFQQTGFSLTPWIPLLCAMIISGFIGTWIGLRVLKRLSDSHFQRLFNWILTLLALRLIWQSWTLLTL